MLASTDFTRALKDLDVYRKIEQRSDTAADSISMTEQSDDDVETDTLESMFQKCLSSIASQLVLYTSELQTLSPESLEAAGLQRVEATNGGQVTAATLRDTRLALRLAASLLATAATNTVQINIQALLNQAARLWTKHVMKVLTYPNVDAKCRLYAARLYCNLITSCYEVTVGPDCLYDYISSDVKRLHLQLKKQHFAYNKMWLAFVETACIAAHDNRSALAPIVAALHNAIIADDGTHQENSSDAGTEQPTKMAKELASSTLLPTILGELRLATLAVAAPSAALFLIEIDMEEEVNEWILLLLEKLVSLGHLQDVFFNLSGWTMPPLNTDAEQYVARPALNIFLACLLKSQVRVFGRNETEIASSLLFMANQFCYFANDDPRTNAATHARDSSKIGNDDQRQLRAAIMCKLVELLADNIGSEAGEVASMRLLIGQQSSFMSVAGSQLAILVDALLLRNNGVGGRKKGSGRDLDMGVEEQQAITGLVRVLGNLAYHCTPNQDLLRTTLVVPVTNATMSNDSDAAAHRNVLHILLSCTSFAWACFTLREWALVAIRNALEGNDLNQALIANLQAQEAVQSESLTDMGIRVDLDNTGKVSVQPLDTHK